MDGSSIETAPSKGAYDVKVSCNNGAEGYWDYEEWGPQIKNITKKTKCSIAFTTGKYMRDYVISLSESNESGVEKISHEATSQTPELIDYRYTGTSPNNYVYFGCSDNCTDDNLYRIIGVILTQSTEDGPYENRVKLIKNNYYTETSSGLLLSDNASRPAGGGSGKGYQWNNSANNQWQASVLQSKVLNGVYYSSLGEYQNFISPAVWYLGAPTYSSYQTYTPDQFYNLERSNTKGHSGGATYMTANIGLMYPSDYAYSIGSGYRGESVYNNAGKYVYNAWLYNLESKYSEWTMTPESIYSLIDAIYLNPSGYVYSGNVYNSSYVWGVRPVFFLKGDVQYKTGVGTKENPYQIDL